MTGLKSSSWISGAARPAPRPQQHFLQRGSSTGWSATITAQQPRASKIAHHLAGVRGGQRMEAKRPVGQHVDEHASRSAGDQRAERWIVDTRRRSSRCPWAPSSGRAPHSYRRQDSREVSVRGLGRLRRRQVQRYGLAFGLVQERGTERLEDNGVTNRSRRLQCLVASSCAVRDSAHRIPAAVSSAVTSSAVVHPPPRASTRSTICRTPPRSKRSSRGADSSGRAHHSPYAATRASASAADSGNA